MVKEDKVSEKPFSEARENSSQRWPWSQNGLASSPEAYTFESLQVVWSNLMEVNMRDL
jgi:hypothetical protein